MDLDQLRALIAVVDQGSLLRASRAIGVSRATLRARIEALEAAQGLQLLVRTQHGAAPTEPGARFVEQARLLLGQADRLAHFGGRETGEVTGRLRLLLSVGLPPAINARFAMELRRRYPAVQLQVDFADDPLSALGGGHDLILYFGHRPVTGPFRTFVLERFPERLLASRGYLERFGRPGSLDDLGAHPLLVWRMPGEPGDRLPLLGGSELEISPAATSRDPLLVHALATAGLGVAFLPHAGERRSRIPAGDLEVVLPGLVGRENAVRVLLPEATSETPRSQVAVRVARDLAAGRVDLQVG